MEALEIKRRRPGLNGTAVRLWAWGHMYLHPSHFLPILHRVMPSCSAVIPCSSLFSTWCSECCRLDNGITTPKARPTKRPENLWKTNEASRWTDSSSLWSFKKYKFSWGKRRLSPYCVHSLSALWLALGRVRCCGTSRRPFLSHPVNILICTINCPVLASTPPPSPSGNIERFVNAGLIKCIETIFSFHGSYL